MSEHAIGNIESTWKMNFIQSKLLNEVLTDNNCFKEIINTYPTS